MTEADLMGLEDVGLVAPHLIIPVPQGELTVELGMTETISTAYAMQQRSGALLSQMLRGEIEGYRVEVDRKSHPAEFHITTWR